MKVYRKRLLPDLLPELAQSLTREFSKCFDASHLRHMRHFYETATQH